MGQGQTSLRPTPIREQANHDRVPPHIVDDEPFDGAEASSEVGDRRRAVSLALVSGTAALNCFANALHRLDAVTQPN